VVRKTLLLLPSVFCSVMAHYSLFILLMVGLMEHSRDIDAAIYAVVRAYAAARLARNQAVVIDLSGAFRARGRGGSLDAPTHKPLDALALDDIGNVLGGTLDQLVPLLRSDRAGMG